MTTDLEKSKEVVNTQANTQKRIIGKPFKVGNPGGPGRHKLTQEQKLIKKEVKKWLEEHEEALAEALPSIRPTLVKSAKKGNMQAFDQIHKVLGAYKKDGGNTIIPIQINFKDEEL